MVEIIDKADGSAIRDEDLKILSVFADLAAQALGNAREIEHDKKEIKDLKRELQGKYEIVGESKALRKVISDAIKVANSKSTTLILGESGTGKELLARMIHRVGVRKDEPMIDHVSIAVSNLEASTRFYRAVYADVRIALTHEAHPRAG